MTKFDKAKMLLRDFKGDNYLHGMDVLSEIGTTVADLGLRVAFVQDRFQGSESFIQEVENAIIAMNCSFVGEFDGAFEALGTLLSMPSLVSIPLLELDPRWAPLRGDPRFEELKKKYGEDSDVL